MGHKIQHKGLCMRKMNQDVQHRGLDGLLSDSKLVWSGTWSDKRRRGEKMGLDKIKRRKNNWKAEARREKWNVPDFWEDNKEACTKRNEENRAKDQAGAEKERHGKKQLVKFSKEEGSANNSGKRESRKRKEILEKRETKEVEERDNREKKQGGKSTEEAWKRPDNWKVQRCGKSQGRNLPKKKVEMSEGALKP